MHARDRAKRAADSLETAILDLIDSLQHTGLKTATTDVLKPLRDLSDRVDVAFTLIEGKSAGYSREHVKRRTTAEAAMKPLASSIESQKQLEILVKKARRWTTERP